MPPRSLELPRTNQSTRPSTLRVYQFRHRRVGGQYSPGWPADTRAEGARRRHGQTVREALPGRRAVNLLGGSRLSPSADRATFANTCSTYGLCAGSIKEWTDGSDQAPTGDLRLHRTALGEVWL